MALTLNGTDQWIDASWAGVSYPFTLSGWFNAASSASNQAGISVANDGAMNHYAALRLADGATGGPLNAVFRNSGGTEFCTSTATYSPGSWVHVMAVFASATDRRIYVGGVQENQSTVSKALESTNAVAIGRMADASPGDYYNGSLAFVAVHAADISSHAADLAAGTTMPDEIADMIAYATFDNTLTVQGTLAWTAHNLSSPTYVAGPDGIGGGGGTAVETDYDTSLTVTTSLQTDYDTSLTVGATISGTVTLSGVGVSGATVRCINQTTGETLTAQTTDASGDYAFTGVDVGTEYHIAVEYSDGTTDYYTESRWGVTP